MYTVYKHTNTVSGKSYIGLTKYDIMVRWQQHHNTPHSHYKFHQALKKYGDEYWIHEILFECGSLEEAKQKEIENIQNYNTFKKGYNSTLGGDTTVHSKKTREKISQSKKGKAPSLETQAKIKIIKSTPEYRKKASECQKGKKLSKATKIKMGLAHLGKKYKVKVKTNV